MLSMNGQKRFVKTPALERAEQTFIESPTEENWGAHQRELSVAMMQAESLRNGQSKRMSFIESLTNVAIGYTIAVLTQYAVFPLFGIESSLSEHLAIGAIFTGVSVARSYVLRRLFNAIR